MDPIEELLTRGVANIIPGKEELRSALKSGKKLNIYLGIDPTSTKIHLGHAVSLRKLKAFAELGHNVTFLIGDFTALIGDTSDKDTERPVLTSEEIEQNFKTYKKQAEKIIDFSKVSIRHNSEWLNDLTFKHVLQLCLNVFSVNDFISRELIRKRLDAGTRVGLQELLYPVMQAYDSYMLKTDVQIGGTDQTFNIQAGRTLIKRWADKESFVLTAPILEGTDGRKMSKSWGNAIWLDDSAEDMFAKVMAVNDDLILQYYILATNLPHNDIAAIKKDLEKGNHPMPIKKQLARHIVTELHSEKDAEHAAEQFEKRVQQKEKPEEMETIKVNKEQTIIDVLIEASFVTSKSEARRLVEQGGVKVDGEKITDPGVLLDNVLTSDETVMQVGPRKFVKVTK